MIQFVLAAGLTIAAAHAALIVTAVGLSIARWLGI